MPRFKRPMAALFLLLLLLGPMVSRSISPVALPATIERIQTFVTIFLGIFIEAVPFLLAGSLVSGLIEVFVDPKLLGRLTPRRPVLAALTGAALGFAFPADGGVQVYHLADGRNLLLLAQAGEPAVWSPRGDALLFTDVRSGEGCFAIHLLKLVLESNQTTDLSGEAQAFDDSPAWSPDGAQIAFGRKEVVGPRTSMGYQVWTMRSDGSQAQPLTADMDVHAPTLAWSPDGRYLLFQHTPLAQPGTPPSIWVLEVERGDLRQVALPGRQPAWLP